MAADRERGHPLLADANSPLEGDLLARLIVAWAKALATRGYNRTTVRDIIAMARMSRSTFYGAFEGKEHAFVSIHRAVLEAFARRVERAAEAASNWPNKIAAGLADALVAAATSPDEAQVLVGDPFAAGPHMGYCHDALVESFGPCLAAGRELSDGPPAPPSLEAGLVGSVIAIVNRRLRAGEAQALPDLAPSLVEFVVAPYVGAEAARRAAGSAAALPFQTVG